MYETPPISATIIGLTRTLLINRLPVLAAHRGGEPMQHKKDPNWDLHAGDIQWRRRSDLDWGSAPDINWQ